MLGVGTTRVRPVVDSIGDVTLEADTDESGVGDVVVKIGAVERLKLGNLVGFAREAGWFCPLDPYYGAKFDGTTDDTDGIQACLDDAADSAKGATVLLPFGVTRISAPLTVEGDNIRLIGCGEGSPKGGTVANKATTPVFGGTVIRPLSSFSGDEVLLVAQAGTPQRALEGVFLDGFSIDGFFLPDGVDGINFQVFSGGIESVTVARVTGDGFIVASVGTTSTFPKAAFDLRLNKLKADTIDGNGISLLAPSSDLVLSDSKFLACGGHGVYSTAPGLQLIGCHIYLIDGGNAVHAVVRSLVITGLRMSDCSTGGIYLVDNDSHTAGFSICGVSARDVANGADNTYDVLNYTPTATIRGGSIVGVSILSTKANRPRYGVNIANSFATGVVVGPVAESYGGSATSAFGTARINDDGTDTRDFDSLA